MALQLQGNGGVVAEVDAARNQYVRRGAANFGAAGGSFVVTGGPSAVVAAAIAANTPLVALRQGAAATTNIYITRLRVALAAATVGASGGVPGQIGWQRFTGAAASGGTARTPARKDLSSGSGTQVADVRDSNAALTVTGISFGDLLIASPIPNFTVGAVQEFVADLDEDEWIRLTAGDGIALRTQVAAPATMTWTFTYSIHYLEK